MSGSAKLQATMRVFLSHSAGNPVSDVRQALANAGAEVLDAFDPTGINGVLTAQSDAIQRSDAFVAVVDGTSPNVFYELGLAMAMAKATLVLQAPDTVLPPFLAEVHHLTTDFRDSKALRFTIMQFLKQVGKNERSAPKPRKVTGPVPRSAQLEELGRSLEKFRVDGTPLDAERTLGAFLKAAHVRIAERGPLDPVGVDFAVWSEGVSSTVGKPICSAR